MAIPYNSNIPQATDIPAQSQSQIFTNFGSIQAIIDVNHADFGMATAGQHNYVQMPVQASAPAVNVGDVGLYNLLSGGINQMFLRKSDGTSIPMTQSSFASPGYTYLPSGIIIQWSFVTTNGTNPFGPINFPIAFTANPFTILTSIYTSANVDPNTAVAVIIPSISTTKFNVMSTTRSSSSSVPVIAQFVYVAIGR